MVTNIRSIQYYLLILIVLSACNQVENTDESVHERHIELKGESNFRDLGGYKTKDGKTIKWGQVYRSGKLSNLSDADVVMLDSLNIQTVVNSPILKKLNMMEQIDYPRV